MYLSTLLTIEKSFWWFSGRWNQLIQFFKYPKQFLYTIINQFNLCYFQCVGHTWYLNVDMQLYILSPIFLFLLRKNYKVGNVLIVFLALSSISYGFYISFAEELSGVSTNFHLKWVHTVQNNSIMAYFKIFRGDRRLYINHFYLQTHTRASPWLLGLIIGYFLVQKKPQKKCSKVLF